MTTELHVKLAVLEGALGHISAQNQNIANDMQQLRDLMERIVRMEERAHENAQALGRAFTAIESADAKIDALQRKHDKAVGWLGGAMFVGSALAAVLSWNFTKQFEPLLTLPQQFNSLQAEQAAIRRTFDDYVRAEAAEKASRTHGQPPIN